MVNKLRKANVERVPKSDFPYFAEILDDMENFCKIIGKQSKKNQILMINSVNVRLVSIIENSIKGVISEVINIYDLDPKKILKEDSIQIDLDILNHMKTESYSKGNIIIAHLDRMNPRIIDDTMSRINKLDFFRWYEKVKETTGVGEFYPLLNNMNKTRNDIMHNLVDSEDSQKDLIKKIQAVTQFIFDLELLTKLNIGLFDKNMSQINTEKIAKQLFPDESPSKSLPRFKKITEKYRKEFTPNAKRY